MADFTLTVYPATRAVASAPNFTDNETAATSGNNYYVPNNGKVLIVANAATTANVTVQTPNTVDGLAITDLTLALADTDVRIFGPFPPAYYNDGDGRLKITVDANTNLMAVRL
jgi:hypothetical protein